VSKLTGLVLAAVVGLPVASVGAETPEEAFRSLEAHLNAQGRFWALNNRKVASAFNEDRIRLGDDFETQLMRYLGEDRKKHYWLANYLSSAYYLHGNTPRPHLALLIMQQGIAVCRRSKDIDARASEVSLSVTAALLADELGFSPLARVYKTNAETLMKEKPILVGAKPIMSEENHKRYDGIRMLPAAKP